MWDDTFYIGESLEDADFLTLNELFDTVTAIAPDATFNPFAGSHEDLNGQRTGIGLPIASWKWKHRDDLDVEALRALCPFLSATVYVRTLINEVDIYGARIYRTFQAVMLWPEEGEEKEVNTTLGFEINFRHMVIQAEEIY